MKLTDVIEKAKNIPPKKKTQYLIVIIILAVILAIYFSTLVPESPAQAEESVGETQQTMETRLEEVLSQVEGAGEVHVVINYESTPELVPATSSDTQVSSSSEEDKNTETRSEKSSVATVQTGGQSEALIIKENQPDVRGVIVVAEGASDIGVRLGLLDAVTTLLNISPDKVEILKGSYH